MDRCHQEVMYGADDVAPAARETATGKPTVSFIIPNYNGEAVLGDCLDSILTQDTEEQLEVIVVDDCSTDGSVELVSRRYPQVKLIRNPRNCGPAASKNLGAAAAAGKYLAFLDTDVILDPGWTSHMLRSLREADGAAAGASHILFRNHRGIVNSTGGYINILGHAWERGIYREDTDSYRHCTDVAYACSAAMMADRETFMRLGGFDEPLYYLYEDTDLGWRMHIAGRRVVYVRDAVAYHLLSYTMNGNHIRSLYLYNRNRLRVILKNMETPTLRWIAGELVHDFLRTARQEIAHLRGARQKAALLLGAFRSLAWNLLRLRDTLSRRRQVAEGRFLPDQELINRGVLSLRLDKPSLRAPHPGANREEDALPLCEQRGLSHKLDMASARDGDLGPGWHGKEVDDRGVAYRWTKERAVLYLKSRGGKRRLCLYTMMAHPWEPTRVTLRVNGSFTTSFTVTNCPTTSRIPLPPELGGSQYLVELEVENPFRPRDLTGEDDERTLGIAVSRVRVR